MKTLKTARQTKNNRWLGQYELATGAIVWSWMRTAEIRSYLDKKNASAPAGYRRLVGAEVVRETEKAAYVCICVIGNKGPRNAQVWCPKSQMAIVGDNEVWVAEWLVKSKLAELNQNRRGRYNMAVHQIVTSSEKGSEFLDKAC